MGRSRGPVKNTTLVGDTEPTLDFESRFESGNLLKAVQVYVPSSRLPSKLVSCSNVSHPLCFCPTVLGFPPSLSGPYEYELSLRADMYTGKHTQWFYFRVRNMKAGATYRFTIINLMKSSSLYSQGMRPLLYSERAAKEKSVGWRRTGSDIRYFRSCSQVGRPSCSAGVSLQYTLII